MKKIENGVSLQPLAGGRPRQIILLLHGFGSNGSDMIALAPSLQQKLPHALFLAPHAPDRCGGGGYQWWALSSIAPRDLAAGALMAAPAVDAFIDRKLKQYDLTEADLALIGFSQGTMMALQVGLRRPRPVACIVGYAGLLTSTADLPHNDCPRPPVLLVHGSADPVVPVAAMHAAESELRRLGVDVTTHVSHGIGHTVDPTGLRLGVEFVSAALGASSQPERG
ncbi:alpha/beta hydrolase [Novosphingobium panipatense]|uniref:Phospholipase/carboxylesterase n=1 Tax=Novosphingobium panipatense TaxID=428991 RepID=A0ABY1QTP1_9SPHN|nr:alpha/beta fold hydrolase [Novosphingobium panipatense]SMP78503.1 phospholipase/carboxylesterase [Novosphingobium panipatense]